MDGLALHIANGVIEAPVAAGYAGLAVAVLAVCVARARNDLNDRLAPMAGLVAAFIFAAQMLNFMVLPGVSGHLIGGALAAILVGPWLAMLSISVVLIVQALVFSDGGLTALGLNITNMALLATASGYLVVALLLRVLPRTAGGLAVAAFLASVVSAVVAALGFVVQYRLGGDVALVGEYGLGEVAALMAGVHTLIGIGEGLIAATTVVTVARVRPDLVYALRGRPLRAPAPDAVGIGRLA